MSVDPHALRARRLTGPTATAAPRASSNGWWGMMLLIATEATLFAVVIASYYYLSWRSDLGWPQGDIAEPKLERPIAMTVVLFASSMPMFVAETGIRRGKQTRLRIGLGATFLLGVAFLALQGWEYSVKVKEFTPETNAYASLFYVITGLHGSHVLAGLLVLAWVQVRAWRGAYGVERHLGVQMGAVYWHFVDAVWAVIFPTIYVYPHL
ncbi:MAG TPA: cytochrome c oxidase subunit 3 [Actinomycetota bacterium]|nr:cytochrome c oxidase subunit 3 [Actinomycetota bacterium]